MSLLAFSILTGSVIAGCVALTIWWLGARRTEKNTSSAPLDSDMVLLFKDDVLIDASNAIWLLLGPDRTDAPTWDAVKEVLKPFAPDLPDALPKTPLIVPHTSGPNVTIAVLGNTMRVTLSPSDDTSCTWFRDLQNKARLAQLEPAVAFSPNPIWCLDETGAVLWSNAAFDQLANDHHGADAFAQHVTGLMQDPIAPQAKRVELNGEDSRKQRWFEVTIRKTEIGVLHFATSVDAVVRAEEAQRNFVQTLSKTFANLTTGLAIFDRNRRLALFNPALIDLSGLSAEFLSGRPNLFEFFDKLRDQQIMPEPKNYDNWRECMAKLVAAASDDRFRETWNIAGGQTYDVTGRPYPDGAIAFLFNDITAEVTLTRGFRTELETMQSSLDAMDDAVAVFSRQGVLTVCNAAYKAMWNVDPDTCIADATILDATQEWKAAFHPAPVWPEIREFVTNTQERASWDADLRSKDGREVMCRVDPICYGSTMVRFCYAQTRRDGSEDGEPLQIVSA